MGVLRQLSVPFLVLNAVLFLFMLWTLLLLEPWSESFTVAVLAGVFLVINMGLAAALFRSDVDI